MEKGVFITWEFWRDKRTSPSEKMILIEINNLSMLEHGCVASNEHFASLMGIKKEAASRLISSLENKGFLTTEIKNGTRNFGRKITLNKLLIDPKQNVISPLTNCLETKGNKSINKTINIKEGVDLDAWKEWESYRKEIKKTLNKTTATKQQNFLLKHKANQKEIIDQSIRNGWTGLFEVQGKNTKAKQEGFNSFLDMKEHLAANFDNYKHLNIEFEAHVWKIGKTGIPYSKDNVDDMPFDQRKRFWIYLMNHMSLLEVAA